MGLNDVNQERGVLFREQLRPHQCLRHKQREAGAFIASPPLPAPHETSIQVPAVILLGKHAVITSTRQLFVTSLLTDVTVTSLPVSAILDGPEVEMRDEMYCSQPPPDVFTSPDASAL